MASTDAFEIDGLIQQQQQLEALLMSNPAMEKKVQGLIRKVLMTARREIGKAASDAMKSDPRKAYKAVKTTVYRQILGGSVSLFNKKHGVKGADLHQIPTRTGRGGNRRTRSQRTIDIQSYVGSSRAFILRFLEAGTGNRTIEFRSDKHRENINRGSRGGNIAKYGKTVNTGARGSIAARNFFGNSSHAAMQKAAEELTQLIDDLIKNELR